MGGKVVAWGDDTVIRIVQCHPPLYRPIASVGAACGLRQGEIFGLAEEDVDFDAMVIQTAHTLSPGRGRTADRCRSSFCSAGRTTSTSEHGRTTSWCGRRPSLKPGSYRCRPKTHEADGT